jgi:hypothetical protein
VAASKEHGRYAGQRGHFALIAIRNRAIARVKKGRYEWIRTAQHVDRR